MANDVCDDLLEMYWTMLSGISRQGQYILTSHGNVPAPSLAAPLNEVLKWAKDEFPDIPAIQCAVELSSDALLGDIVMFAAFLLPPISKVGQARRKQQR